MNTRATTQKVIKNIYSEKKSLKFKYYTIRCLLSAKESSIGELEEQKRHEIFKKRKMADINQTIAIITLNE